MGVFWLRRRGLKLDLSITRAWRSPTPTAVPHCRRQYGIFSDVFRDKSGSPSLSISEPESRWRLDTSLLNPPIAQLCSSRSSAATRYSATAAPRRYFSLPLDFIPRKGFIRISHSFVVEFDLCGLESSEWSGKTPGRVGLKDCSWNHMFVIQ